MKKIILIFVVALFTTTTYSQNIAIKGYDPVAYFESNTAVMGQKDLAVNVNEAVYYFSSEQNKALFLKNPTQYQPQYGGYCAYGMSNGYEAPIEPEAFTIVDNKLYLNYNLKVREMWLKEQSERIEKANANWEKRNKK